MRNTFHNLVAVFRAVRRVLRPDGTLWVNIGDSFVASSEYSDRKRLHSTPALAQARRHAFKKTHLQRKSLYCVPFRLAIALADDGWIPRSDIVVEKNNPAPESVRDRPSRTHEYVLFYTKTTKYHYDGEFLREAYAVATKAKGFNQVGDNPRRPLNPNGRNGGSVWHINNGVKGTGNHPGLCRPRLRKDVSLPDVRSAALCLILLSAAEPRHWSAPRISDTAWGSI